MKPSIHNQLSAILAEVFYQDHIPKDICGLKLGDLPMWDSIGNFNLLLAIEDRFSIRFTSEDLAQLNSIEQIIYKLRNFEDQTPNGEVSL